MSLIISLIALSLLRRGGAVPPPSKRLCLSSFEAALSLLLRGGSVSLPFLRRDALALLRCCTCLTLGLWQTGIWEFLAAGLANACVRVSAIDVSCVHAVPPKNASALRRLRAPYVDVERRRSRQVDFLARPIAIRIFNLIDRA